MGFMSVLECLFDWRMVSVTLMAAAGLANLDFDSGRLRGRVRGLRG